MNQIAKAIAKIGSGITFSIVTVGASLSLNNQSALAQADYYYIQARHSGQCLNVLNSGQSNGDDVVQGEECDSENFQWSIIPASRGYYYIQARHSGQCLNVLNSGQSNGDNVVQGEECDSTNFQWAIIPTRGQLNYIEAKHSGQCLNVLNGGENNGDTVVQGEECDSTNFQWSIIPVRSFKPSNSNPAWQNPRRDRQYNDLRRGPIKR